jgi:hypothetical protein
MFLTTEPKVHMFDLILPEGWLVMDGSKIVMDVPTDGVLNFSLVEGWVAMTGPQIYMTEHKVCVFDFMLH